MFVNVRIINGLTDLSSVYMLRKKIFGTDKVNLSKYFDCDRNLISDGYAIHAVLDEDGTDIGVGSLFYDGEEFYIDNVGVLPGRRGQLYGKLLIRVLFDKVMSSTQKRAYVYGTEEETGIFSKMGFEIAGSNNEFLKLVADEDEVLQRILG